MTAEAAYQFTMLGLMWLGVIGAVIASLYAALWVLRLFAAHVRAFRLRRKWPNLRVRVTADLVEIRLRVQGER